MSPISALVAPLSASGTGTSVDVVPISKLNQLPGSELSFWLSIATPSGNIEPGVHLDPGTRFTRFSMTCHDVLLYSND
ncbi:unnamed protein product [Calypogeia fissa]